VWQESGGQVAETTQYLHADHLNSVEAITGGNREFVARLRFDPFGREVNDRHPAQDIAALPPLLSRAFTGHEQDQEGGLINMGGRVYDPNAAHFLTPDPVLSYPFASAAHDPYAYVMNNPMTFTDPSGFEPSSTGPCVICQSVLGALRSLGDFFGSHHNTAKTSPNSSADGANPSRVPWTGGYGPGTNASGTPSGPAAVPTDASQMAARSGGVQGYGVSDERFFPHGVWGSPPGGLISSAPITDAFAGRFGMNALVKGTLVAATAAGLAPVLGSGVAWIMTQPGLILAGYDVALGEGGIVLTGGGLAIQGTGAFLDGAAGGAGFGKLAGKLIQVSEKGISLIEEHLAQFGVVKANTAMIGRLRAALSAGETIGGADASFYMHEVSEATMMGRGIPYEAAHAGALGKYGVSPYSVYHPEVIQSNAGSFNSGWRAFWGLE
jgi:RHS repeat-associated protein